MLIIYVVIACIWIEMRILLFVHIYAQGDFSKQAQQTYTTISAYAPCT
jgi:predicted ABC-type sugar transport system permease subunit